MTYSVFDDEWYPVHIPNFINDNYAEYGKQGIEFTTEEISSITNAFKLFDEAQDMIMEKLKGKKGLN